MISVQQHADSSIRMEEMEQQSGDSRGRMAVLGWGCWTLKHWNGGAGHGSIEMAALGRQWWDVLVLTS